MFLISVRQDTQTLSPGYIASLLARQVGLPFSEVCVAILHRSERWRAYVSGNHDDETIQT